MLRESEILEGSESKAGNFGKVGYFTSDSATLVHMQWRTQKLFMGGFHSVA